MVKDEVKTLRTFESDRAIGELQKFSYQLALGISVRKFEGEWALRIYFLGYKFWINFKKKMWGLK